MHIPIYLYKTFDARYCPKILRKHPKILSQNDKGALKINQYSASGDCSPPIAITHTSIEGDGKNTDA